jgi:NUMOD3 motif
LKSSHTSNSNQGWRKEHRHTEETKLQMSLSRKGKSPWNKGIPRTDEEKIKISQGTILGMKK